MLDNMEKVRSEVRRHRDISSSGARFAVVEVEAARRAVMAKCKRAISFKDLKDSSYPSHAGIYGYAKGDFAVEHALSEMAGPDNMHPTISGQRSGPHADV